MAKAKKTASKKGATVTRGSAWRDRTLRSAGRQGDGATRVRPKQAARGAGVRRAERTAPKTARKAPVHTWLVLRVTEGELAAAYKATGTVIKAGTMTRLRAEKGRALVLYSQEGGPLSIARINDVTKQGVVLSQAWKADESYRLTRLQRHNSLTPSPNLPPVASFLVGRLP